MKKIYLIKNQELFQGKKYLLKDNKNYFEGWYFKNTDNDNKSIAFIPGISINNKEKRAFIQIITDDLSYFVNYDINDFIYNENPFFIKIKNNYFSNKNIYIDIKNEKQKLDIHGEIKYLNNKNIKASLLRPNIMGPFSYVPFMECNHGIISMKNNAYGLIKINKEKYNFNNGIGYIEKDWGISFPKTYLWCQANNFKNNSVSFMFSLADIPFKLFKFKGMICVLIIDNKEYRFTTYNMSKIIDYEVNKDLVNITIKRSDYYLNIKSFFKDGYKLSAPVNGVMSKDVYETVSAHIKVTLRKGDKIIFSDKSINCGLEIV